MFKKKGNSDGQPETPKPKSFLKVSNVLKTLFPDRLPQLGQLRATVEKGTASTGKNMYLRYLNDGRITARQAILANCYDCSGQYVDGRHDCENPLCPCYPFMPYRSKSSSKEPNEQPS